MALENILLKFDEVLEEPGMKKEDKNILSEPREAYLTNSSEIERLRKDVFRSDMEKLHLFTKMLRTNALLKNAKITHK